MIRRFLLIFLCTLFASFTFASNSKVVRVGYYYVPKFQEGTEGSGLRGYAYEYYQRISQYTGWRYEYTYGNMDELQKLLQNGEIDLLAGMSYQKEREGSISYPARPMGTSNYYLLKKTKNPNLTRDIKTLQGKKIGAISGTMAQGLSLFLEEKNIEANVKEFQSPEERDLALEKDSIDAIIIESISAKLMEGTEVIARAGELRYYVGVSKKRPDILSELNEAQELLQEAEPLLLDQLRDRYMRSNAVSKALSSDEKDWVEKHNSIKIGYLRNMLPYSDESLSKGESSPDGIIKDIMPEILEQLGINRLKVEFTAYNSYDQMLDAVTQGREDAIFPVGGSLYNAEQNGIHQSTPVTRSELDLIFKGNFQEKKLESFAVNTKSKMMLFYIQEHFPDAQLKEYDSIEKCLQAVVDEEVSATVLGNLRSFHILKMRKYSELSSKLLNIPNDKYFGVAIGNDALLRLLNRGLALTGEDFATSATYKYSEKLYKPGILDSLALNTEFVIIFFVGTIIIIILIFARRFIRIQKIAAHEKDQNEQLKLQLDIIKSISNLYHSVFLVDPYHNSFKILHTFENMAKIIEPLQNNAQAALDIVTERSIVDRDKQKMWNFNNVNYWKDVLKDNDSASEEYEGKQQGWCRATILVAQRNLKGDPTQVIYISQEINKQKKAELKIQDALIQAERANNAKSDFLNNMSHDIRTPMNAIIGFTTLASTHINNQERLKDYLEKIDTSSKHLLALINDVLDMRRIESGRVKLEMTEINLPALLDDIKTIVMPNILRKQQEFIIDADSVTHVNFITDKLRLNQVLLNLLSNAIKFTRSKGNINLKITEKPCQRQNFIHLEIRVKDNGIGMSKEFQKHIFEAFSREETSTVSGTQGTGLGMAITKNIVDMMAGSIEIQSEEDYGTEFIINLEFKQGNAPSTEQVSPINALHFADSKILLAEDNPLNQEIATTILTEAGFNIDIAENGQVAVQKIISEPANTYKLVLMDIQMPIMDGYEATRRIRQIPNTAKANTPIIAMTANAFEEDRKKAFDIGMNGYLAKPIDLTKLMEVLSSVIKNEKK